MRTFAVRVVATLSLTLIASACAGGGGVDEIVQPLAQALPLEIANASEVVPTPGIEVPDITSRPISDDQLLSMLPDGSTGVAATDTPIVLHARSNDDLITDAVLDREDEVDDITRFRRLSGVGATYDARTYTAHVWVDVLADRQSAHEYLLDTAGDAVKGAGGTHAPGIKALSADEFPVAVGEESIGMIAQLDGGSTETIVMSRVGRVVVFSSVVHDDDRDLRVPAQYLGEETVDGILATLTGAGAEPIGSIGPDSYRFSFEMTVEGPGDDRLSVSATGRSHSGDTSCRVRMTRGDSAVDRDLVSVGGNLWARDHGRGDYHATGSGLVTDRALFEWCPAWPIDVVTSGLMPLLDSTPAAAELETGPALGYRVDAAGLGALLGENTNGVTVEVFNVWLSAGSQWMVDLGLTTTGTSSTLDGLFGSGFGPNQSVTVTIRQQVSDLGSADPISAPGL